MTPPDSNDWQARHAVLYDARLSALYHRALEQRFGRLDKLVKVAALVLGSAAFSSLVPEPALKAMAAAVSSLAVVSLVFAWDERARFHSSIATRWGELESDILSCDERAFTPDDLRSWQRRAALLQVREPAQDDRLVERCQRRLKASYA